MSGLSEIRKINSSFEYHIYILSKELRYHIIYGLFVSTIIVLLETVVVRLVV